MVRKLDKIFDENIFFGKRKLFFGHKINSVASCCRDCSIIAENAVDSGLEPEQKWWADE